jgi:hypothetical protein
MDADGADIFGIADEGEHFLESRGFGVGHEGGDDGFAHTLAAHVFADIDAVFDRKSVGFAGAERAVIAKAEASCGIAGDHPGISGGEDIVVARPDFLERGRDFLEGSGAV